MKSICVYVVHGALDSIQTRYRVRLCVVAPTAIHTFNPNIVGLLDITHNNNKKMLNSKCEINVAQILINHNALSEIYCKYRDNFRNDCMGRCVCHFVSHSIFLSYLSISKPFCITHSELFPLLPLSASVS